MSLASCQPQSYLQRAAAWFSQADEALDNMQRVCQAAGSSLATYLDARVLRGDTSALAGNSVSRATAIIGGVEGSLGVLRSVCDVWKLFSLRMFFSEDTNGTGTKVLARDNHGHLVRRFTIEIFAKISSAVGRAFGCIRFFDQECYSLSHTTRSKLSTASVVTGMCTVSLWLGTAFQHAAKGDRNDKKDLQALESAQGQQTVAGEAINSDLIAKTKSQAHGNLVLRVIYCIRAILDAVSGTLATLAHFRGTNPILNITSSAISALDGAMWCVVDMFTFNRSWALPKVAAAKNF